MGRLKVRQGKERVGFVPDFCYNRKRYSRIRKVCESQMETRKKKLPIGVEDFEKLRKEDFYYIDKTGMIKELLEHWAEVNLFTRPRRFGKSLNMSMLKHFFDLNGDKSLFEGLDISWETELCEAYMGIFPVISISLKGINAVSYEKACEMVGAMIRYEVRQFQYLLESDALTLHDKEELNRLLGEDVDEGTLCYSLKILSGLLSKHHRRKVVLLIDEYDVPLAKAFEQGYYDQMTVFIRIYLNRPLRPMKICSLQFLPGVCGFLRKVFLLA